MATGTVGSSAQWDGLFERSLKTTIKPTQRPAGFYFHQGEYSEQSSWEGGGWGGGGGDSVGLSKQLP